MMTLGFDTYSEDGSVIWNTPAAGDFSVNEPEEILEAWDPYQIPSTDFVLKYAIGDGMYRPYWFADEYGEDPDYYFNPSYAGSESGGFDYRHPVPRAMILEYLEGRHSVDDHSGIRGSGENRFHLTDAVSVVQVRQSDHGLAAQEKVPGSEGFPQCRNRFPDSLSPDDFRCSVGSGKCFLHHLIDQRLFDLFVGADLGQCDQCLRSDQESRRVETLEKLGDRNVRPGFAQSPNRLPVAVHGFGTLELVDQTHGSEIPWREEYVEDIPDRKSPQSFQSGDDDQYDDEQADHTAEEHSISFRW